MSTNPRSEPTTPVRIPKAVASYTPTIQDPEIRSNINARLLADGQISKIHDALLHSLHASPQNWPSLIQSHALSLLRSGEITTFGELLTRVLSDIKADTAAGRADNGKEIGVNGSVKKKKSEERGRGEGGVSLALPRGVIEEGLRVTREALEEVCVINE